MLRGNKDASFQCLGIARDNFLLFVLNPLQDKEIKKSTIFMIVTS